MRDVVTEYDDLLSNLIIKAQNNKGQLSERDMRAMEKLTEWIDNETG